MLRWTNLTWRRAALAAALAAVPGTAIADVLVVRSIGPSAGAYKPGRKLPDGSSVALKAGDQLTLLDNKGTRTLKGPGTFNASAAAGANGSLASLAGDANNRRVRTGAVRDVRAVAAAERPNIWYVDASKGGTTCINNAQTVSIWRKDTALDGDMTVTGPNGAKGAVTWIKGQAVQPWPAAVPVQSGGRYTLSGPGALATGTTLNFAMVNNAPSGLSDLGGALLSSGCQAQLDVLIATTSAG